jgi:HEAT repeat protein
MLESGPVIEIVREPASGVVTPVRADPSEPRAKHPDEIPMAAFWSADKEKSGATRTAGSGSGPVQRAADDTPASRVAERSHARAPSEPGDVADELSRKSRVPLVVVVLLALGAGGFLVYQYLLKSNVSAATRPSPPEAASGAPGTASPGAAHVRGPDTATVAVAVAVAVAAPVPPAAPAPIDREAAVAQARGVLTQALTATSLRVQHLAAAALARTEDPVARDVLAAQLGLPVGHPAAGAGGAAGGGAGRAAGAASGPIEPSDIAKLDLAYALARSGDRRGTELLAGALRSVRGEVRDESARLLALLGDPRGVPHLLDLLAIPQRRLGAAESLAHLTEPHAIKVLHQLCDDPKTSADDRIRAAIALGIAGQAGVGPALHDMLGNAHFNAFAAAALAEQKDAAARPVLEQQLASSVLRVRAARALRRLDPGGDPAPVLPGLLAVLRTGRDTDQVQAAEAILLLAGPPGWSAYE